MRKVAARLVRTLLGLYTLLRPFLRRRLGDSRAVDVANRPTALEPLPFGPGSRIVIVGGGPAGIHMASRLSRNGFEHVTILERSPEKRLRYGKTETHLEAATGDAPHELGTCYVGPTYATTRALFDEYLGGVDQELVVPGGERFPGIHMPAPSLARRMKKDPSRVLQSDEWLYASLASQKLPEALWHVLPAKLQVFGFLLDIMKYRALHESIFGRYTPHGLPPKPSAATMEKLLSQSYAELMISNGLETLLELCSAGLGSYGFGYDVPALYGLWMASPEMFELQVLHKVDPSIVPMQVVKRGFGTLWRTIVEKDSIAIRHGVQISSIRRSLDDPAKPITIEASVDGKEETIECDFLVFAAPMHAEFMRLVEDATPLEREVCSSLETVGLVVSVFETDKKPGFTGASGEPLEEIGLTFYPEALQRKHVPEPSGEVYAERNTVRCFRWDEETKQASRYTVAYQYFPTARLTPEEKQDAARQAETFLASPEATCVPTTSGTRPMRLLEQRSYDYFPHFRHDAVQRFLPWKVFEQQGKARTFYIGSSVSFESAEDVVKYNRQVLGKYGLS